jgi:hypothetical protein
VKSDLDFPNFLKRKFFPNSRFAFAEKENNAEANRSPTPIGELRSRFQIYDFAS